MTAKNYKGQVMKKLFGTFVMLVATASFAQSNSTSLVETPGQAPKGSADSSGSMKEECRKSGRKGKNCGKHRKHAGRHHDDHGKSDDDHGKNNEEHGNNSKE